MNGATATTGSTDGGVPRFGGCSLLALRFLLVLLVMLPFGVATRAADAPHIAFAARVAGDVHRARIIIDFDRKPDVSIHYVGAPNRIVVDLPQTAFAFAKDALAPRGLFANIRYGAMGPGRARIVILTKSPARIDLQEVVANEGGTGFRLILDAATVSQQVFDALVKAHKWVDAAAAAPAATAPPPGTGTHKLFTVVLDPGHGGIDSGAIGVSGTLEKDVTLAFAEVLRSALKAEDVNVVMTRDGDDFVSLADRVKVARNHQADLFISLHANSISLKSLRGATVYTLSDKASDKVSQRLAEDENRADSVAGLAVSEEPQGVADILMDLTRRETHVFSVSLADKIVSTLNGNVLLVSNPHRYAGFRVLEAPDVPSVLVELGYLTNPEDEKELNDPKWREKVAGLLTKSILAYRSTVLASRN